MIKFYDFFTFVKLLLRCLLRFVKKALSHLYTHYCYLVKFSACRPKKKARTRTQVLTFEVHIWSDISIGILLSPTFPMTQNASFPLGLDAPGDRAIGQHFFLSRKPHRVQYQISLCGSEVTRKIKQLIKKVEVVPQCLIADDANGDAHLFAFHCRSWWQCSTILWRWMIRRWEMNDWRNSSSRF